MEPFVAGNGGRCHLSTLRDLLRGNLTLTPLTELERIASLVPLRRLAEPEDHAQAMLFLASDAAAYLNGVTLDVNGGRIMM